MKNSKSVLVAIGMLISYPGLSQTLHLTNVINYGKHITDIEFSKTAPYLPLNYIYKLHPEEAIVEEVMDVSDGNGTGDSASHTPPSIIEKPKPEVKYALQVAGMIGSMNLGPGEFCEFLCKNEVITADEGDSIFRRYIFTTDHLKCTDSLIFPSLKEGSSVYCHDSHGGKFFMSERRKMGDSSSISFYDSAFTKVATIKESKPETEISFINNDRLLILNWRKQSPLLILQEHSLTHGKIAQQTVDMPNETSSWGIGTCQVNDTMTLVYAQMYRSRETWVYALNQNGKIYWKKDIPDYIEDLTILKSSNKMVCTFYNVQGVSTIKFYSLLTGEFESTINLAKEIPEFAASTAWSVYLPMRSTFLPGGKWYICLIDCYSPSDQSKSAYYLLVSNGTKTFKTKLRKNKSITSTKITPLSSNKMAVVIDDDIYYYSIY